MTPEQQAIRQFLSRSAPTNYACGCMGEQLLSELAIVSDFRYDIWPYNPNDREPLCSCAMKYAELVDGIYYQISEQRSPDGITHEAKVLGPVGGPYNTPKYGIDTGESHIVKIHKKTAAERIQELKGVVPVKKIADLSLEKRVELANQLALDPKNYNWKSKTVSNRDGSFTKTEIINGEFVVTNGVK